MCIKPGPGHPGKDAQAWFVFAHAQVLLTEYLFQSPTAMSDVMGNVVVHVCNPSIQELEAGRF